MQWEKAKGELRAMIALIGSTDSNGSDSKSYKEYIIIDKTVNDFILDFESNGYHE